MSNIVMKRAILFTVLAVIAISLPDMGLSSPSHCQNNILKNLRTIENLSASIDKQLTAIFERALKTETSRGVNIGTNTTTQNVDGYPNNTISAAGAANTSNTGSRRLRRSVEEEDIETPYVPLEVCPVAKDKLETMDRSLQSSISRVEVSRKSVLCLPSNATNVTCQTLIQTLSCNILHIREAYEQAMDTLATSPTSGTLNAWNIVAEVLAEQARYVDQSKAAFEQEFRLQWTELSSKMRSFTLTFSCVFKAAQESIKYNVSSQILLGYPREAHGLFRLIDRDVPSLKWIVARSYNHGGGGGGKGANVGRVFRFLEELSDVGLETTGLAALYQEMEKGQKDTPEMFDLYNYVKKLVDQVQGRCIQSETLAKLYALEKLTDFASTTARMPEWIEMLSQGEESNCREFRDVAAKRGKKIDMYKLGVAAYEGMPIDLAVAAAECLRKFQHVKHTVDGLRALLEWLNRSRQYNTFGYMQVVYVFKEATVMHGAGAVWDEVTKAKKAVPQRILDVVWSRSCEIVSAVESDYCINTRGGCRNNEIQPQCYMGSCSSRSENSFKNKCYLQHLGQKSEGKCSDFTLENRRGYDSFKIREYYGGGLHYGRQEAYGHTYRLLGYDDDDDRVDETDDGNYFFKIRPVNAGEKFVIMSAASPAAMRLNAYTELLFFHRKTVDFEYQSYSKGANSYQKEFYWKLNCN